MADAPRKAKMKNPFDEEDEIFCVLVNAEMQYLLWPAGISIPAGWGEEFRGPNWDCIEYIDREWTDMRPATLRGQMRIGRNSYTVRDGFPGKGSAN